MDPVVGRYPVIMLCSLFYDDFCPPNPCLMQQPRCLKLSVGNIPTTTCQQHGELAVALYGSCTRLFSTGLLLLYQPHRCRHFFVVGGARLLQVLRTCHRGGGDEAGMRAKVQGRGITATVRYRPLRPPGLNSSPQGPKASAL